jgi:hypothetical protein
MRASQSVRPNKRKKSFRRSFILEKNVPWEIKFKSNIALRCITRLPTLAKPRGQLGHLHFESPYVRFSILITSALGFLLGYLTRFLP